MTHYLLYLIFQSFTKYIYLLCCVPWFDFPSLDAVVLVLSSCLCWLCCGFEFFGMFCVFCNDI
jgi:hypothetical protein